MEINKILNLEPKEEQVEKLIEYKLECQKEIGVNSEVNGIFSIWCSS